MMPFARPIARLLWFAILWWMRRPFIKRMRRAYPNMFSPEKRAKVWEQIKAQDQWAMKHGRGMLTVAVSIFLASAFVTGTYMFLVTLQDRGWFDRLQSQSGPFETQKNSAQ